MLSIFSKKSSYNNKAFIWKGLLLTAPRPPYVNQQMQKAANWFIWTSPRVNSLWPHHPKELSLCSFNQTHSTSLTLRLESGLDGGVTRHGCKGTVSPDSSAPTPTQLWDTPARRNTVVPAVNPDSPRARARDAILSPPALFLLADAVAVCRAPASSVRKPRLWEGRL